MASFAALQFECNCPKSNFCNASSNSKPTSEAPIKKLAGAFAIANPLLAGNSVVTGIFIILFPSSLTKTNLLYLNYLLILNMYVIV